MIAQKNLHFSLCPSLPSWQFCVSSKTGLANDFKLHQGSCEECDNMKCHWLRWRLWKHFPLDIRLNSASVLLGEGLPVHAKQLPVTEGLQCSISTENSRITNARKFFFLFLNLVFESSRSITETGFGELCWLHRSTMRFYFVLKRRVLPWYPHRRWYHLIFSVPCDTKRQRN